MPKSKLFFIVGVVLIVGGLTFWWDASQRNSNERLWLLQEYGETGLDVSPIKNAEAAKLSELATHRAFRSVEPMYEGRKLQLNTYCLAPDGNLWLCCDDTNRGRVLQMTPEGELVGHIDLAFVPTAINFTPDKTVCYVAGADKIVKLSATGEIQLTVDLPNAANDPEKIEQIKELRRQQAEQLAEAYEHQLKRLDFQIERLEAQIGGDAKLTPRVLERAERRLELLNEQRKELKTVVDGSAADEVVPVSEASQKVTGLAVTNRDVFVAILSMADYGYELRRFDFDLAESTVVNRDLSGCCEQLDIQADGDELLVAENTKFEVGRFDRDGNRISGFGNRTGQDLEGWGSCCNPMNIRCDANGNILTAESSIGHIKRYDKQGNFIEYVGTAKIGGGCKHVAIAHDSTRDWYYFMNIGGNNISVLLPKDQAVGETKEEKEARLASDKFGKKLLGTWVSDRKPAASSENDYTMASYILNQYKSFQLLPEGEFSTVVATTPVNVSDSTKKMLESLMGEGQTAVISGERSWEIVGGTNESVDFVIIEQGVASFGATVRFLSEDEATFDWFYGDRASKLDNASIKFKRTALAEQSTSTP